MSSTTLPEFVKIRLQGYFQFTRLPFRKSVKHDEMFDSRAQRELLHGLQMCCELHGMALVTGPAGEKGDNRGNLAPDGARFRRFDADGYV